jgi:hypothetical protein
MTKRSIVFSIVGAGMLLAIVGLWLRVRALESTVGDLTSRLQALPRLLPVMAPEPRPAEPPGNQQIFKLIDSDSANDGKSRVGVPWNVERAMIIDAVKRNGKFEAPKMIDEKPTTLDGELRLSPPPALDGLPNAAPMETSPDSAF